MLVKPPYFTPWTPPLGIAILKSYLAQHGYRAQCFDFNIDPDLWGMHHKYFAILQELEDVSINDGYSKLWWILNSHMLAAVNGADASACAAVLRAVIPLYGIRYTRHTIERLIPLVEKFFQRLRELTTQLELADYSVVGTSTYTTSLAASLYILRLVKQLRPEIKTIMGGGIFADDLALGSENLAVLLREYPYVDHLVLGEGELILLKILTGELAHLRTVSIADVQGQTLDMKEVPNPDFSDLNNRLYHHLSIEGARSCPFQCSFCSETIQWGDYRKKPIPHFVDQVIKLADDYHLNTFFLGDSLMNPYLNPFAAELLKRQAHIFYDGYLRADKPVTNRKFVKLWADSGLFRVRLGLESASAKVLNLMDKMTTPEVISAVLKVLASAGIRTTTYWIVGFPGETEEDFQATCEFIRQHHRLIYELEAHPYYYYPYGQVGSRLYQCYSIYPPEVTEIIKFKVWEIVEAKPTREERYDRLRRISALAASLGLPNIYTMAERYQAEDRWTWLHPQAREVYGRSRLQRSVAQVSEQPRAITTKAALPRLGPAASPTDLVHGFQVTVQKRLDENLLTLAMRHLIEYNEILLLQLEGEQYVAPAERDAWRELELVVVGQPEPGGDPAASKRALVETVASAMRPEPGRSVKVVLFGAEAESCDLLLVAHRAIADSRSVVLLFEDLFRIYEQLDSGQAISLPPVELSWADLCREVRPAQVPVSQAELTVSFDPEGERACRVVTLDPHALAKLDSDVLAEFKLSSGAAVAVALLAAIAQVLQAKNASVAITRDLRTATAQLSRLVSPLMIPQRVPASLLAHLEVRTDRAAALRAFTEFMAAGTEKKVDCEVESVPPPAESFRLLLNLDYLIDEPWLGGDDWLPKGFLPLVPGRQGAYDLELTPLRDGQQVQLYFRYQPQAPPAEGWDRICTSFPQELNAILDYCERYLSAKRYWLTEFARLVPTTKADLRPGPPALTNSQWRHLPCRLKPATLTQAALNCQADLSNLALCAFAVLLSRLSGQESLTLLSCQTSNDEVKMLPLRLYPSWNSSLLAFAQQVNEKVALADYHRAAAFEVLLSQAAKIADKTPFPLFDATFLLDDSAQFNAAELEGSVRAKYGPGLGKLDLILQVTTQEQNPRVELVYRVDQVEAATMEKMGHYLQAIFQQAATDARRRLGDVTLAPQAKASVALAHLALEDFQF